MTYLERMVIDGLDRDKWLAARYGNIGGSNAGSFAKVESAPLYLRALLTDGFTGNQYTRHGNAREVAVLRAFGVEQNLALFHAEGNTRHVCTPDGIKSGPNGVVLVQVKTSSKPITKIPPVYLRQIWWEQYVMGTERTLFAWEEHKDFYPLNMEPESIIVERDDAAIDKLITIADLVLEGYDRAQQFKREMESSNV